MRNMSFSLTTAQFEARTKTVTRRLGWKNLKEGEVFMGVEKGMGLKKGEKVKKLHAAKCVSNRAEPLSAITPLDVIREGFPHLDAPGFIAMFCKHNNCKPETVVQRIVFEHL